jgi:hypothetical protein
MPNQIGSYLRPITIGKKIGTVSSTIEMLSSAQHSGSSPDDR